MKSGVNIDCKYLIRVKKIMETVNLPRPTKKKFLIGDGEILQIIKVHSWN